MNTGNTSTVPPADEAIVCAYRLGDRPGSLDWAVDAPPPREPYWVHFDRLKPGAAHWLAHHSGLDPLLQEALLADETRPRYVHEAGGLLLILRGVNLNPGADPEDMVSIRIWLEADRLITLRNRPLQAVRQLREQFDRGEGFSRPGEIVAAIASGLVERVGPIIGEIDEELDALEEQLLSAPAPQFRNQLSALRRQTVALRRHLSPQREVLHRLANESVAALTGTPRNTLRESADQLTRQVEDLDALRERAAVTQEELIARLQDGMNANMYRLSVVAAIFLPLGFLTGLLGINVGGMPGVDSPLAFWIVCAALGALVGIELLVLLWRRWL